MKRNKNMKSMQKLFWMGIVMIGFLFMAQNTMAAVITINPIANEGGERTYGSTDSFEVFHDSNNYTPVGVNSIWGSYMERRMSMEFDLSQIPSGASINSAVLTVYTGSYGGSLHQEMDVYAAIYAGDGNISSSDFNQTANRVGGPYHYDQDDWLNRPPNPLVIDVSSVLPDILNSSDYAGFTWFHEGTISGSFSVIIISTLMNEQDYGDRYPTLQVDYSTSQVPIPSALLLFGSGILGLVGFRKR